MLPFKPKVPLNSKAAKSIAVVLGMNFILQNKSYKSWYLFF